MDIQKKSVITLSRLNFYSSVLLEGKKHREPEILDRRRITNCEDCTVFTEILLCKVRDLTCILAS